MPTVGKKVRKLLLMDEHVCPWWFAYTFDNPLRRLIQPAGKMLAPYVQPGMIVLDIGCGLGYFSLELARRVGQDGRVIAVDLQERALRRVRTRAQRHGLADRITLHQCSPDQLGVQDRVDFILTFWMVHEVPEPQPFLNQLHDMAREGGKWLIAEPKGHTSQERFDLLMEQAGVAGFRVQDRPAIRLSYAAVLERLP